MNNKINKAFKILITVLASLTFIICIHSYKSNTYATTKLNNVTTEELKQKEQNEREVQDIAITNKDNNSNNYYEDDNLYEIEKYAYHRLNFAITLCCFFALTLAVFLTPIPVEKREITHHISVTCEEYKRR